MSKPKDESSVTLTNVRLSFPKLIKAETFKGQDGKDSKPKFSAAFLIPKSDTETVAVIKKVMMATAIAKWGPEDGPVELKRLFGQNKTCLIDGDNASYDGYAGHFALRTSSTPEYPPTLVDEYAHEMNRENPATAAKFYAGCYVNAIVRFWAQGVESGFGKRLNASLGAVQFAGDGEAFGAGKVSADAFEPMPGVHAFKDEPAKTETAEDDIW